MHTPHESRMEHWQQVYRTRPERGTSWYQAEPAPSLELVRACARPPARFIDVGGGESVLAGRLAADGFDVTVLDISASAIDRARARIGDRAATIHWIIGDVTAVDTLGPVDVWHDRAVFHFLTDAADRRKYVALAERSVRPGGHIVIATFGLAGPEKCSGLPVERYDRARLAVALGPAFTTVRSFDHTHHTPWGTPQAFVYSVLRRSTEEPSPQ